MNEILDKYSISIHKISKYLNYSIIEDYQNKKYLIKIKDSNLDKIFSYLKEMDYPYYVPFLNDKNDSYQIYPYYEDHIYDNSYKGKEIINAICDLELKSMEYHDYSLEQLKEYYDQKVKELDDLMNYYLSLQETIENSNSFSPSSYFLLLHISEFYHNIRFSRYELERWYSFEEKRMRTSYLIGDVSFSNFRIGDKKYFIDYKNYKRDFFLEDIISFYRKEGLLIDMISLFDLYQSKISLTRSEKSFFFFRLLIPNKVSIHDNSYSDCIKIRREIDFMNKSREFYLKENKEDEETNQKEFKQENEDI